MIRLSSVCFLLVRVSYVLPFPLPALLLPSPPSLSSLLSAPQVSCPSPLPTFLSFHPACHCWVPLHFDSKGWACGTLLHITYVSLWLEQVFASSSSACHFIAMVSFPRIVTPQANQIDMLIRILLARSILDLAEDIPESLSTSSCDLLFSGIPQPAGGLHLSAVLDAMGGRLQSWPTSPLVVLAQPRCLGSKPVSDYLLGHCRPCFHLVPLSYLRLGPVPSWTTSRVVFLNMQPSWFLIRLGLAESSPKLWPAWAPCKRSGFCFNGYPHGLLVQLSKLRGNGPLRRISYSILSVSKALAHSWRRHIGNFSAFATRRTHRL